jgi:CheY-like chemotaxis protein
MDQYRGGCPFMSNKKKILVVDDDADIRRGHQVLLTAHHHDTLVVSDELPALQRSRCPQARSDYSGPWPPTGPSSESILILPEPGGFLVMERLTADKNLALIPVSVVSGLDPNENIRRALRGGATGFCAKAVIRKTHWRSSPHYLVHQSYLLPNRNELARLLRSTAVRTNLAIKPSPRLRILVAATSAYFSLFD